MHTCGQPSLRLAGPGPRLGLLLVSIRAFHQLAGAVLCQRVSYTPCTLGCHQGRGEAATGAMWSTGKLGWQGGPGC